MGHWRGPLGYWVTLDHTFNNKKILFFAWEKISKIDWKYVSKKWGKDFNLLILTAEYAVCVRSTFALGVMIKFLVWRQKLRVKRIFEHHTALLKDYLCCHHNNQLYKHAKHLEANLLRNLGRIYCDIPNLTQFSKM